MFNADHTRRRLHVNKYYVPVFEYSARADNICLHDGQLHLGRDSWYVHLIH